jgi:hypothetical protein
MLNNHGIDHGSIHGIDHGSMFREGRKDQEDDGSAANSIPNGWKTFKNL